MYGVIRRFGSRSSSATLIVALFAVAVAGCGSAATRPKTASRSTTMSTSPVVTSTSTLAPPVPSTTTSSTTTTSTTVPPVRGDTLPAGQPLAGKVVGIDPGHNGANSTDPGFLAQQIFNGRTSENCDTAGTETNAGYTEAQYNFNVAQLLTADLQQEGAKVVLTRSDNTGVGPCVDQRAEILNSASSNVAIDIHADGGPPGGRGVAILEPVADGPNNAVITSSETFGNDVQQRFLAVTGMPISTYDGTNGIAFRSDLAGLNLATEPKVLIECGNMRNGTDAALLVSTQFQENAALALAQAITDFLQ
jgi:N-acetylmuramoyl-L-alanine amidase